MQSENEFKEMFQCKGMKLFVFSWNMAYSKPDENLIHHFEQYNDCDIVIIGTQESSYKGTKRKDSDEEWFELVETTFGSQFVRVSTVSLSNNLRLIVLAKQSLFKFIYSIERDSFFTALPPYWNKGAVAVSFKVQDISFCFVNVHLSAHEGPSETRHLEMENILRSLKLGNRNFDISNQFHYLFVLGDLNYRIIKRFKSFDLHQGILCDELTIAKRKNKALRFFKEGQIRFLPTYKKYKRQDKYDDRRIPSWCDRILYYPMDNLHDNIQLLDYNSVKRIQTSDHLPVYSVFRLNVEDSKPLYFNRGECVDLEISSLMVEITYHHLFKILKDTKIKIVIFCDHTYERFIESNIIKMSDISEQKFNMKMKNETIMNYSTLQIALYSYNGGNEILLGVSSLILEKYLRKVMTSLSLDFRADLVWSGLEAGYVKGNFKFERKP